MADYQIGPLTDAGPNQYTPSAGSPTAHADFVREAVSDGDTTYLQPSSAMTREAFTIDATALPVSPTIASLTIHVAQKESTAGAQSYKVGFTIGGTDYYGSLHSLGSGSSYAETDDQWTTNPATSAAWTAADVAAAVYFHEQQSQAGGLPRPHLSQCVLIADAVAGESPEVGDVESQAPRIATAADLVSLSCAPHSLAPKVGEVTSLSPDVDGPTGSAPRGE